MSIFLQRPGINSEVKTPFRWYANAGLKNKRRKNCRVLEQTCGYRLITPFTRLLPFQFYRTTSAATIARWEVFTIDGVLSNALDETLIQVDAITNTDTPCDYVYYDGQELGIELQPGYYYSEVEDSDGNIWHSEDFYVSIPGVYDIEMAVNPEFSVSGTWTITNGSIADGQVCQTNTANPLIVTQSIGTITSGFFYRVVVRFSSMASGGNLTVDVGGTSEIQAVTPDELTYTFFIEAGDFANLTVTFTGVGCFTEVSMKQKTGESTCNAKLVYSHDCDFLGNLYYPTGYENEFFFDEGVEPIALTPNIIREYDENGNKDKILRRQRRETTYRLDVGYVPWYVADALVEMSLHDNITLHLAGDTGSGDLKNVEVEVDWDEFGDNCLAKCTISFQLEDATTTDGCCDDALIPPISVPCTELFCDPLLDGTEAVVTDFTYTDIEAIELGLSVDDTPTTGAGTTWTGQQLCTGDEAVTTGSDFIDFNKTLVDGQKYRISFTVDSIISGSLTFFLNGVTGGTISAPGDYEYFFVPDPGSPVTRFQFTASSDFRGCITFNSIDIWVPCATPLSYGWLGYEDGLIFGGSLTGNGTLQFDDISSNYVYSIEIDYSIPSDGDCLRIQIGSNIVATIISGTVPAEGTYSFTFDPRNYSIPSDQSLDFALIPCDGETSLIGITGIRLCGTLY